MIRLGPAANTKLRDYELKLESVMAPPFLRAIKSAVNKLLAPIGISITRTDDHDWNDTANFIPFERIMERASKAKMSVGDYVDTVMNGVPGSSQSTIDKMASLGVFSEPMGPVVEIGPGTGRYLEKTLRAGRPSRYEIYETAGPWSAYLVKKYNVALQPTDGYSLSSTADSSADMVHAHKVFSTVSFMVTCCYWHEMARVIRPGGWAVFDVFTESCLAGEAMQIWAESGIRNGSYPAVMPREIAVSFFTGKGFTLAGSFIIPMPPATTELLVFKRGR
jgi:SAM-dependent methyltransferase